MASLWAACAVPEPAGSEETVFGTRDSGEADGVLLAPPRIRRAQGPGRLLRAVELHTRDPEPLRITVDDGVEATERLLPATTAERREWILELRPDRRYDITVEVLGQGFDFEVVTEPLPAGFPTLEVLTHLPERTEPGFTLFRAHNADGVTYLIAVDGAGEVVWYYEAGLKWADLRLLEDGTLLGTAGGAVVRTDLAGEERASFESSQGSYHHEAAPRAGGGFHTLMHRGTEVDDFPKNYSCEATQLAEVKDQILVEADASGEHLREHSLLSILDPTRIGWGALKETGQGADWGHANAVVAVPGEDALVVSVRHQDAVAKIDRTTGALQWILATHDNWSPRFAPHLLTPVGDDFTWPFHQHAPALDGSRILLFDNGNEGDSPCGAARDDAPAVSRLVIFEIDEAAMEIRQIWSWSDLPDGPLFSNSQGDADWMPTTGNVLGVWGFLWQEGKGKNTELGRGARSARIVEIDPVTDEIVWDLNVYSADPETVRHGWTVYRAERVPSLYPASD